MTALDKAWAGVDVGQTHHWICVVDPDGQVRLAVTVSNDEAQFLAVIRKGTHHRPGTKESPDPLRVGPTLQHSGEGRINTAKGIRTEKLKPGSAGWRKRRSGSRPGQSRSTRISDGASPWAMSTLSTASSSSGPATGPLSNVRAGAGVAVTSGKHDMATVPRRSPIRIS